MVRGTRVRLYFNLHKKNFTVQTYITGNGWRKAGEVEEIILRDVEFKVSEAGRQRVIREGKKNVHAFAEGTTHRFDQLHPSQLANAYAVSYNPYKYDTFVDVEGGPVRAATFVLFSTTYGVKGWGLRDVV